MHICGTFFANQHKVIHCKAGKNKAKKDNIKSCKNNKKPQIFFPFKKNFTV